MSRQYLRKVRLVVGAANGEGLDLSALRIVFNVRQWDLQTPNNATFRIYNVGDKTAEQVKREYTRVLLQAGYEDGPFGTVFDGSIVQAKKGRESAVDTYLDVVAADGDQAYNFAIINKSYAAGMTSKQQFEAIVKSMNDHGVTQGYTPELPAGALPRGKVLFGMSRDHLRTLGTSTDTKWSIQDGEAQLVPLTGVIPGVAIVINAGSGMIGIPEQTQEGIKVRTLLNPDIKMSRAVQINNADINQAQLAVNLQGQVQNFFLPSIADDGFYRVIVANHSGDTRGNDFYTDIICIALDSGVTPGLVSKGYG